MKFPTNTRCLVMWALLAFYVFFIVSYYLSKFREGATGTTGTSGNPINTDPSGNFTKMDSSGNPVRLNPPTTTSSKGKMGGHA